MTMRRAPAYSAEATERWRLLGRRHQGRMGTGQPRHGTHVAGSAGRCRRRTRGSSRSIRDGRRRGWAVSRLSPASPRAAGRPAGTGVALAGAARAEEAGDRIAASGALSGLMWWRVSAVASVHRRWRRAPSQRPPACRGGARSGGLVQPHPRRCVSRAILARQAGRFDDARCLVDQAARRGDS